MLSDYLSRDHLYYLINGHLRKSLTSLYTCAMNRASIDWYRGVWTIGLNRGVSASCSHEVNLGGGGGGGGGLRGGGCN